MGDRDRIVQKPVLYIQQPQESEVTAPMQSYFYYKKEEKQADKKGNRKQEATGPNNENRKPENGIQQNQVPERRRAFKEMSIPEKVNYFVNMPDKVPKMKCEVITEEMKKYRGYIQSLKNDLVNMKTFQQPFQVEIPLKVIQDIKLIGF